MQHISDDILFRRLHVSPSFNGFAMPPSLSTPTRWEMARTLLHTAACCCIPWASWPDWAGCYFFSIRCDKRFPTPAIWLGLYCNPRWTKRTHQRRPNTHSRTQHRQAELQCSGQPALSLSLCVSLCVKLWKIFNGWERRDIVWGPPPI
jgi:hypothetical protein